MRRTAAALMWAFVAVGARTVRDVGRLGAQHRSVSRRAMVTAAPLILAQPLHAFEIPFFPSPTQQSLKTLASALPKIQSLVSEVKEIKRLRAKIPADPEDDAYVLRFARSVLLPLDAPLGEAIPALGGDAARLGDEFRAHVAALDQACRDRAADRELAELQGAADALRGLLTLAPAKYDVKPVDDVNSYTGATGVLYNKFLFRAG